MITATEWLYTETDVDVEQDKNGIPVLVLLDRSAGKEQRLRLTNDAAGKLAERLTVLAQIGSCDEAGDGIVVLKKSEIAKAIAKEAASTAGEHGVPQPVVNHIRLSALAEWSAENAVDALLVDGIVWVVRGGQAASARVETIAGDQRAATLKAADAALMLLNDRRVSLVGRY